MKSTLFIIVSLVITLFANVYVHDLQGATVCVIGLCGWILILIREYQERHT
jgi:hypothetical protein